MDERRKELLLKLLSHPHFTWRTLTVLSNVIGLDFERTKALLLEVGARGSANNPELWSLESRNPVQNEILQ